MKFQEVLDFVSKYAAETNDLRKRTDEAFGHDPDWPKFGDNRIGLEHQAFAAGVLMRFLKEKESCTSA